MSKRQHRIERAAALTVAAALPLDPFPSPEENPVAKSKDPEVRLSDVRHKVESFLLKDLKIDPSYQRGKKPSSKRIAKNFDETAALVLTVGRREDGTLWLVDGQQRRDAMLSLGIDRWDGFVFESSGSKHEAAVFKMINGPEGRTGLTARDIFKARLSIGEPAAREAADIVLECGFKLAGVHEGAMGSTGLTWPVVNAHAAISRQVRIGGGPEMRRVFNCIRAGWHGQPNGLRSHFLRSLFLLYNTQGERIDDERMVKAMRKVSAQDTELEANFLPGYLGANIWRVLAKEYNKRLTPKNQLDLDRDASDSARAAAARAGESAKG
jgi:hypothetical protein